MSFGSPQLEFYSVIYLCTKRHRLLEWKQHREGHCIMQQQSHIVTAPHPSRLSNTHQSGGISIMIVLTRKTRQTTATGKTLVVRVMQKSY